MSGYADPSLRQPSESERWEGPAFRAELTAWVTESIGEPTSVELAKIRPWASVWRVETPGGVHFAKQNCSGQAFEAAVLEELAELAPHHVVPVTAVDRGRGLLMTPDQGDVLGEAAGQDIDTWCRVVAAGAALQREVAPHADRLAAAGLTTLAPQDTTAYVEQALEHFDEIPPGDPRAMSAQDRAAVRAHLPMLAGWADQVAALGLPVTLVHNDLHGHNVFDRDGELRFFDFADALLMEPLAAIFVPVNALAHGLEAGPADPRLHRVADAALEVWSDLAPAAELRAALPAAFQLARLARAESWARCLPPMTDAELAEWGDSAGWWLASILLDPVLVVPQ